MLQISKVIFPLITAPYVARVLDPEGVGLANFATIYSSYFALFAVLGIPMYGIREITKRKNDLKATEEFVSQMISIELVSTFIMSFLYILSIFWIDQLNVNFLLFLVAGFSLYFAPFKIEWFFSGREEFGFITFRSLVIKTISVALLFVCVRSQADLINYILLNIFSSMANEFWNYVKLFKLGIRPHLIFKGWRLHFKGVIALFASSIAISIYVMLDTLMLGFQSSYDEVGYYNSAMHIIKALLPIATALSAVAVPRVASFMHKKQTHKINELMSKSLGVVSFLAFPITLGIIAVSPIFVPLFFGEKFAGAVLPMQIGSVLILLIGLNNLNGVQVLIGLDKDKQFFYSVLSGAIANFLLNLILIPRYGAVGATIASVYAETQILIVNEYFVRKYTDVRVNNLKEMYKALIGALLFLPICCGLCIFFNGWLYVGVTVVLCTFIYIAAQFILRNSILGMIQNMLVNKLKTKK